MDNDVLKAIDALEDGETKTNLETLMDNVHTAMEALHDADDDSREAAGPRNRRSTAAPVPDSPKTAGRTSPRF